MEWRRLARQFWWLAGASVTRAFARSLRPPSVYTKVGKLVVQPTETDAFRKMLSDTAPTSAVPGRIVLVCGSLQPGGAERQVANTLIGLAASSVESVTLLCDYLHGGTKERYDFYLPLARSSGATVRMIRTDWDKTEMAALPCGLLDVAGEINPNLMVDIANLYLEFRALRPEVVHAWLDWSNVRAGLAAVLAGVPRILLSGRNLSPRHFALNTDYYYPAYKALIERAGDRIVLLNNSQAGADDYAEWLSLPPGRIKVIRNGIHFTEDMRPAPEHNAVFRIRHGIPPDAPLIGGMFRFYPEKQPLLWLEVAGRIAQVLPDAHFVIFGEGLMRARMEEVIRTLGIEQRTRLCGVVTPSLDGLAPCDLILLTSSGEGTPNVLLEAQWLGLPVVTTAAGGAGEAVLDGVTGVVVKTNDAAAIADAVIGILQDKSFRDTARHEGPSFIAARYGMARMIDETLAAYWGGR